MVDLQRGAEGIILPVQAQPGARKNAVTGVHAGRLKVAVTQAPEKGKANKALIDVLAAGLGIRRSQIRLVAGETSCHKKFLISGVESDVLQLRIAGLIGA